MRETDMCSRGDDPTAYEPEVTTVTMYHDLIGHEVTHDPSTQRVRLTIRRQEGGDNTSSFTVTVRESDARVMADALTPPYNGWANYETWAASLWLSNDEETYHAAREAARSVALRSDDHFVMFVHDVVLGEEPTASLATDLLTRALDLIDYVAIREALAED